MVTCLGIYREIQNSPNRETDDSLILSAVMKELEALRVRTELLSPEAADGRALENWDMIVPMCESYPRLMRLKELQRRSSAMIVNPPDSVLACYRTNMLAAFRATPALSLPPSELRNVALTGPLAEVSFDLSAGLWVKRGDVHNTCSHDVVFARDWADVETIRKDFARREISQMLLQQHIDGDLIKFYGVGPNQWFTWFYHDPETARRLAFEIEALAAAAATAAAAVKLEVFGGDAIVAPDGKLYVIDINSWPSFAKVRAEAARQIARLLAAKLHKTHAQA